jgi:hypothetical protein
MHFTDAKNVLKYTLVTVRSSEEDRKLTGASPKSRHAREDVRIYRTLCKGRTYAAPAPKHSTFPSDRNCKAILFWQRYNFQVSAPHTHETYHDQLDD